MAEETTADSIVGFASASADRARQMSIGLAQGRVRPAGWRGRSYSGAMRTVRCAWVEA